MYANLQEEILQDGCVDIFNSDRCLWSTLALCHSTREHGFKNSAAGDQHIFMSPDVNSCSIWWSHFEADVRCYFVVQHVSHALRQSPLRLPFSITTWSHHLKHQHHPNYQWTVSLNIALRECLRK